MQALADDNWPRVADVVHRLVGRTLSAVPVSVDELQWGGHFVIDAATREVVGSCAFKAPPTPDGTVEIAYFTYPLFEGRGYATAMARKLVALASASTAVRRIIAHTLPESDPSVGVPPPASDWSRITPAPSRDEQCGFMAEHLLACLTANPVGDDFVHGGFEAGHELAAWLKHLATVPGTEGHHR